jgi:hypothetical protein
VERINIVLQHEFVLLDLLLQVVHFSSFVVDFFNQSDVFVHDFCILFAMIVLVFLQHPFNIVALLLKPFSLLGVEMINVRVASVLAVALFFYILLVKSDNASLELFEVCDVVQAFENVVFELFFVCFLLVESCS